MDEISAKTLVGREGETFTIAAVDLRLVSVTTSAVSGGGSTTATFAADAPHGLSQDVFLVGHPELADTGLLVVPSSPTEVCVTFTWIDPAR